MAQDTHPADVQERDALIHREFFQVTLLIVAAVVLFLLTRAVAGNNRQRSLADAAEWYRRGRVESEAGHVAQAIDAFRHATVRNREEKSYALALAGALARGQDMDAARATLVALRESAPEDAEINLELGRLAAQREDVTEALRFYHNALYAPWPPDQLDARRAIRIELIRFLLTHAQKDRALAELVALSADLPDEPPRHRLVGELFASAGDAAKALGQFQRVLAVVPDDLVALTGAARAAFDLRDDVLARSYLLRLPSTSAEVQSIREVVDLVLSSDPLAPRIGSAERRRRLLADLSYAQQRWRACLLQRGIDATDNPLGVEARGFEDDVTHPGILEQDTIEAGVELIARLENEVAGRCGPPTQLDQALERIGRTHGVQAK